MIAPQNPVIWYDQLGKRIPAPQFVGTALAAHLRSVRRRRGDLVRTHVTAVRLIRAGEDEEYTCEDPEGHESWILNHLFAARHTITVHIYEGI